MILVTGGTGAMGSVLVQMLAKRNERVRVVCMPHDRYVSRVRDYAADIRYVDVSRKQDCVGVCDGVSTVLHLAAIILSKDESAFRKINVQGTHNIIDEAKRANIRHFVYVSSASVAYPRPTPYSLSKREAENIVRQSGLVYTIVRPTLVYGRSGGQEFDLYLDYLKKYPVIPFIGDGSPVKRPVFVDDVNSALLAICGNEIAFGKTYNLSGGEPIRMIDFTRLCLRLLGLQRKPIVHVPVWLCTVVAGAMKLVMSDPPLKWQVIAGITQDANLDPSKAMADLGYAPKKVSECLPEMFPRS
jgi:NADH dehydrogenase